MSLEERVGQLFMVGTPVDGSDPTALQAIAENHIGGVFLHSPATGGVDATAQFVSTLTAASDPSLPPLWVSTDQEGGEVQVLSGPGFDAMPSALDQGALDPAKLRTDAAEWGAQLAAAGVTLNLAPVADIVDGADAAAGNPPIGALDREYGYDEAAVTAGAGAFAQGMRDAGVVPTLKHFPGLGHVTGNTDFASGVVDGVVTADGPDVDVYRTLLGEGDAVVMMSTAIYTQIDPSAPAAFSKQAVTGLLRDQLGFDGVVTTDDLSAAQQVGQWAPADRATLAIDAGVDLLLVSTDPSVFAEMYSAVLARAQSDPAFAAEVDAAARRVVTAKTG
jgi:beta-N-acetylhexosaminidase